MPSDFLRNIFNKQQFTNNDLEEVISRFTPIEFTRQDFLLRENQVQHKYWFIETGFVRSFVTDPEGNDISTNFYVPGDIAIDWPSFFLRKPSRENIQALTDCQCWQIDFDSFQHLFHTIKNFREQGRTRLVSAFFELKSHSISLIADQAKTRYLQLLKDKPQIIQHVSLKHIASYLGITDTSLSRIRKEISQD